MTAVLYQGDPIMVDHTPSADVTAGDVIVVGASPRVAHRDIKNGELGALAVFGGIYTMIAAGIYGNGVKVYWDDVAKKVTTTAGTLKVFGETVSSSTAADGPIRVFHNPGTLLLLIAATLSSLFLGGSAEAQIFRRVPVQSHPQRVCIGNECFEVRSNGEVVVNSTSVASSAPVIHSTVVAPQASAESIAEANAKRAQSFRKELLKAAEQGVKEGDISRLDMLKLRVISLNPAQLERIHQAVSEQAVAEGRAVSIQAIDWSQMLDFIKELLPIILQLISLFG